MIIIKSLNLSSSKVLCIGFVNLKMWLLKTRTYRLERFDAIRKVPRYAILSHTWSRQETTFEEWKARQNARAVNSELGENQGTRKVIEFCDIAASRGYEYAWMDTCCIDKGSSAVLDEEIRSMYQWYENAKLCIVFLADVAPGASRDDFRRSKWFTRGWTLQELIAPPNVVFFDNNWEEYGSLRFDEILDDVCKTTGIDGSILRRQGQARTKLASTSIAKRMSWASNRETTRIEDEAYCLMGIFNVQMPIMYGEGRTAFYRLQKAILETSIDQSIFAWKEDKRSPSLMRGMLAQSPSEFSTTGHFVPKRTPSLPKAPRMDACGLNFDTEVIKMPADYLAHELKARRFPGRAYFLSLLCCDGEGKDFGPVIIFFSNGLGVRILPSCLFSQPPGNKRPVSTYTVPVGK